MTTELGCRGLAVERGGRHARARGVALSTDVTAELLRGGPAALASAQEKDWLLQDQVFWCRGAERIEPCDLLTPERHFIHVKKGLAASDLSHLFGQASGSADLLHRHRPFIHEMKARYETKWPGTSCETAGRPKVVLAIARPAGGELFGKMLLSRINVLEHARRVQGRGFDFAVCRVELQGAAA